jgi:hypothetical protein
VVLAEPASFYDGGTRLALSVREVHFAQTREAVGKIGEDERGEFAFISARAKQAGERDPFGSGVIQASIISSV